MILHAILHAMRRHTPEGKSMRTWVSTFPALALAAVVVTVLVAAGPARGQDEDIFEDEIVRLTAAPVIGVKITKDNWQVVYGEMEEGGITVPADDVMETVYADAPVELLRGFQRVSRGYLTKAIEESFEPVLKKLDRYRKVEGQPWPKQYGLYYLGVCHLKRGNAGDAAKARQYFERLTKEVPDSRFIFQAYTGVGDSLQVEKKYAAAAAAFTTAQERFEKMSRTNGLKMETVAAIRKRALKAQFRQGEMYDMAGQFDKAVTIFKNVAVNSRKYPDLYFESKSAAVKALVSTGAYRQAIRDATTLISEGERAGRTEFLGGAYMGLADCYFAQHSEAEKEGKGTDPEQLVIARYNYLRVLALYFEDASVLPKAHFRAGRCYEKLSQAGEGGKAVERARRHYKLVEALKDSVWSKEARSRLAAIGN